MDAYITVAQAASLPHVSPTTVRRWMCQGSLPAPHLTGRNARVLIDKSAWRCTQGWGLSCRAAWSQLSHPSARCQALHACNRPERLRRICRRPRRANVPLRSEPTWVGRFPRPPWRYGHRHGLRPGMHAAGCYWDCLVGDRVRCSPHYLSMDRYPGIRSRRRAHRAAGRCTELRQGSGVAGFTCRAPSAAERIQSRWCAPRAKGYGFRR